MGSGASTSTAQLDQKAPSPPSRGMIPAPAVDSLPGLRAIPESHEEVVHFDFDEELAAIEEERQPEVQMRCSGEDKNQEAILFHSDHVYFRERIHFHRAFRENFKKVVTEAHFKHAGMGLLRVVTTHLPGAPFGRARKEFADCIAGIVKGEKLPTVLLADLNFPEKAVQPLLLDHDLDVSFVPTPYPTNICQGSLLPKRIDSIAVINHEVKGATLQATALKAEDVLDGLREVVDLLKSRSAEPWTPTRYQSDKDPSGRWSMNFTYTIGPEGNEGIFDGKVQLLDRHVYNSVSAAVNYLNDGLSVVPEGYCVVFSGSQQNYYLLWREDKKAEVFSLLGLSDQ